MTHGSGRGALKQGRAVFTELVQSECARAQPRHQGVPKLYVQKARCSQGRILNSDVLSVRIQDSRPCGEQFGTRNHRAAIDFFP